MTWQNRIVGYGEEAPDQLLANPANWRTHPKHQTDALAGVLREVGLVQNVIVNRTTGFVVDGHARIALALRDGQPAIPVTYVELDEAEEALILASLDPIGAMAGADAAKLDALLREVSTGEAAVQEMLAALAEEHGVLPGVEPGAGGDEFDATPEDGPTRCQPGDLWVIGGVHRLICGDSTDPATVARLMGGEKPGAVVSDPPYGIKWNTDPKGSRGGKGYAPIIGDDKPFDPAHLMGDWEMVLWGANYYADKLPTSSAWVVWDKRPSGYQNDQADCEMAWTNLGGPARIVRKAWSGGGTLARENGAENRSLHPTQKPLDVIVYCIERCESQLIVDFYLGSGTTLIAAHRTGRRCYGVELEPRYCDVILRRAEAEGLTVERADGST